MSTPLQDVEKAKKFFMKHGIRFQHESAMHKAVAALATEFFIERTNGRTEDLLELRVTMGDIAQKAMKYISDECLEVLVNHNGRNMVLQRDVPKRRKKG